MREASTALGNDAEADSISADAPRLVEIGIADAAAAVIDSGRVQIETPSSNLRSRARGARRYWPVILPGRLGAG